MNEISELVYVIRKLLDDNTISVLDQYMEGLKSGNIHLSRIIVDEMQDYYNELENKTPKEVEVSKLCDELYSKTLEYYESNFF